MPVLFILWTFFDDPDDKLYDVFESFYNNILDEHLPLKYARARGSRAPYMNNQWCSASRVADSLPSRSRYIKNIINTRR